MWIARHGAGQDHLERLRAAFIDTVPNAKRAQWGDWSGAGPVARAERRCVGKLNDAVGGLVSRQRAAGSAGRWPAAA
ncbi:hypothetical protein CEJ63_24695 [Acinetobacter baumannii]|nr:hypothetical protein CEJ63_24695 [Acinetobacter baumannii]